MTFSLTAEDRAHLGRTLELAVRGRGSVSPNPLVGAVIVSEGEILGEGWHAELGGVHAEVAAIADARGRGHDPAGATIYVSLEPCAHEGRQPPCTQAILDARLARVVVAADDPSAKASGLGPRLLRERGVIVDMAGDPEAETARRQNQPFRKHARTGVPWVVLKAALSLDGRIATASGDSKWISAPESRKLVHRWRTEVDAVAVGIGTALADDPLLTARPASPAAGSRQPARVVFDSDARLPLGSQLLATVADAPVYVIAAADRAPGDRLEALREAGAHTLAVEGGAARRIALGLAALGELGLTSVLLEGGARLAGTFLAAGELDELRLFYAPLVLGDGVPVLAGPGGETVAAAHRPLAMEWTASGPDMLARATMREW